MDRKKLKAIIENLLLVSDQPITLDKLSGIIGMESGRDEIKDAVNELMDDYAERGLQIQFHNNSFSFVS